MAPDAAACRRPCRQSKFGFPRSPSQAIQNIVSNVERLVKQPATRIVHITALAETVDDFHPDAIVLSGTLRDFDYYKPEILDNFRRFIRETPTPVLGICGGHQLVGL